MSVDETFKKEPEYIAQIADLTMSDESFDLLLKAGFPEADIKDGLILNISGHHPANGVELGWSYYYGNHNGRWFRNIMMKADLKALQKLNNELDAKEKESYSMEGVKDKDHPIYTFPNGYILESYHVYHRWFHEQRKKGVNVTVDESEFENTLKGDTVDIYRDYPPYGRIIKKKPVVDTVKDGDITISIVRHPLADDKYVVGTDPYKEHASSDMGCELPNPASKGVSGPRHKVNIEPSWIEQQHQLHKEEYENDLVEVVMAGGRPRPEDGEPELKPQIRDVIEYEKPQHKKDIEKVFVNGELVWQRITLWNKLKKLWKWLWRKN
jgi:hypothetical protein